jgi:anti-anti-sigma factor
MSRPPELSVEATRRPDRWLATVSGELDISTARVFEERIAPLVQRPVTVALDLGRVPFIDSAGLAALMRLRRVADQHGAHLVVATASDFVRRIINITGLAGALNLHPPPTASPAETA